MIHPTRTRVAPGWLAVALTCLVGVPLAEAQEAAERSYYVMGLVRRAGEYALPIDRPITVRDAISTAGGFEPGANDSSLEIVRSEGAETLRRPVDLDAVVLAGDAVVVGSRQNR